MNRSWRAMLEDCGARFEADKLMDFGDPSHEPQTALSGNIITDLSHLAIIEVSGSDAGQFLHGQFTSDVLALGENSGGIGSWCTPKGRVITVFRIVRQDICYYLLLSKAMLAPVLRRLTMYVLRADVQLKDASDLLARIGLSGPGATGYLQELSLEIPNSNDTAVPATWGMVIRIPGPHPRFILLGDLEPLKHVWRKLLPKVSPTGASIWSLLDIVSGLPNVDEGNTEAFLPQTLNLDALGGLSFDKGCYPGQEIVARLKYRGELKRRMYLALAESNECPAPGTDIHSGESDHASPIGEVVEATRHLEGNIALLAVLQIAEATKTELHLGSSEGPVLRMQGLPYVVDE